MNITFPEKECRCLIQNEICRLSTSAMTVFAFDAIDSDSALMLRSKVFSRLTMHTDRILVLIV
jgi:hypothetical protein